MKTFTNHTAGPRGFNLHNGTTLWLEPGQSAEIDPKSIVGEHPDLGKPKDDAASKDDAELVAAVQTENADLKKQVADQAAKIADLTAKLEAATKK